MRHSLSHHSLQSFHLSLQRLNFPSLPFYHLPLRFSLFQSCRRHALPDATLRGKFPVLPSDIFHLMKDGKNALAFMKRRKFHLFLFLVINRSLYVCAFERHLRNIPAIVRGSVSDEPEDRLLAPFPHIRPLHCFRAVRRAKQNQTIVAN